MTYFIEKPTYHTTEFKIRFDKQTEKEIPCTIIDTQGNKTLVEYETNSGKEMKWIDNEQLTKTNETQ